MWEIESNSVGSTARRAAVPPAHRGCVGTPLWGCRQNWSGHTDKTLLPKAQLGVLDGCRHSPWAVRMSGAVVGHLLPCQGPLRADSGRGGRIWVVTSAGDRLSQAVKGGSGSALAPSTVPVTAVAAGAQVFSDRVFRRPRSLRTFLSPVVNPSRNSLILRMLAANS